MEIKMTPEEWHNVQVNIHGFVKKPIHYKIAQWRAIEKLVPRSPKPQSVIDIGCAEGSGMLFFHYLGFDPVMGMDVNPEKVHIAQQLGLGAFVENVETTPIAIQFDVIWCSHVLEHTLNPVKAVQTIVEMMKDDSTAYFILPYPDTGDPKAHCASPEIGLKVDDGGFTVVSWFDSQGLYVSAWGTDDFREPEIWLKCEKL